VEISSKLIWIMILTVARILKGVIISRFFFALTATWEMK